MNIRDYLKEHPILTDGAMGTYYVEKYRSPGELSELQNLTHPERIVEIHREYLKAGAQLIRTNSFSCNLPTLFGGEKGEGLCRAEKLAMLREQMKAAYRLAEQAVWEVQPQAFLAGDMESIPEQFRAFLAGDMGPIPEQEQQDPGELLEEYLTAADALLEAGAEILWFETFSDFQYLLPVAEQLKKKKADLFIMASFCLNKFGYTRAGISASHILEQAADSGVFDGVGFNCGIGATHMHHILKKLDLGNMIVSAAPNSGYPDILNDRAGYQGSVAYFCEKMKETAALGVYFLGGCCGTTPDYIRQMSRAGILDYCPRRKTAGKTGTAPVQKAGMPAAFLETPPVDMGKNEFYVRLQQPGKPVVVELDPPYDGNGEKLIQASLLLKEAGADVLTFADSPMGKLRADSIITGIKIQREIELPVMPHVTCRDRNRLGMGAALLGAHMSGIRNLLLITGDPVPGGRHSGITPVFDFTSIRLMEYVRQMNTEYFKEEPIIYGGAFNYGRANLEKEMDRMKQKIEAGASFFLTQPVYCREDVERIAYVKARVDTRILCGIMPLVSYRNANFMKNEVSGVRVPEEIIARYRPDMSRAEGEETGVEIALELADALKDVGDGYYFMTPFNRAAMICTIMKRMKAQCLI